LMTCAADVTPEPVRWLWPGRIAEGKQVIIGGEPGQGKSNLGTYAPFIARPRSRKVGGLDVLIAHRDLTRFCRDCLRDRCAYHRQDCAS
jgi:hypothetical protein